MRMMHSTTLLVLLLLGCSTGPSTDLAIAAAFDDYSQLLHANGDTVRANQIASSAAEMRKLDQSRRDAQRAFEQGRPYDTSYYLGFMPDGLLREYAADLRTAGRPADAQEAEALAARYRNEQTEAVERLLRGQ